MKLKSVKALLFLVVYSVTPSAMAQPANMVGVGATTCREALRDKGNATTDYMVISWVAGFLSGVNLTNIAKGAETVDLRPFNKENVLQRVYARCAKTPDAPVISTVEDLYLEYGLMSAQLDD